jgi:hypothetical protein
MSRVTSIAGFGVPAHTPREIIFSTLAAPRTPKMAVAVVDEGEIVRVFHGARSGKL